MLTLASLLLATSALAYHHPSKGIGITCSADVKIAPLIRFACDAPVLHSERMEGEGRNVFGHNYRTTNRIVDRAACLEAETSLKAKIAGDTSKDLVAPLALATEFVSVNAAAVYKSNAGTIDVETDSRGDLDYIYYNPSAEAEAAQKALVSGLASSLLRGATVSYDSAAKTLTLSANGVTQTQPSDLSVGSLKGSASFILPVSASFPGRVATVQIGCGALQ